MVPCDPSAWGARMAWSVRAPNGGRLKRPALGRELDDVAVDLHTRLKAAFDPAGILNPGKSVPLR